MKVLLVGNGGREHAIARALVRTSTPEHPVALVVQAGNPALEQLGRSLTLDPMDPGDVVRRATSENVDLVVVGPEAPLVAGVADAVLDYGIPVFGPTKGAARLEASKSFAKEIMADAGVATARSFTCTTMEEVSAAFDELGAPHVVKDDALAAGKGVVVTSDREEASAHARACLARDGGAVVVEDYLDGPEVSLFCVADGETVVPLQPAQDFKRVGDGNEGPNTGGMGAYSPLPWLPEEATQRIVDEVARPVITEMARRGTPFRGLLYCGLAMTSRGIRVVEFNVRFGDPETQAVLERLESPLAPLLHAAATGTLSKIPAPVWSEDAARPTRGTRSPASRRPRPSMASTSSTREPPRRSRMTPPTWPPGAADSSPRTRWSTRAGASLTSWPGRPPSRKPVPWPIGAWTSSTSTENTTAATSPRGPTA